MPCCCIKTLNLCKKPVCGNLVITQAAALNGNYTLLLDYLETSISVVSYQTAGEDIFFNISDLNENFQYTGQIFDSSGNLVTVEDSPESYDCIKFKTGLVINASGVATVVPPVLNIPGTVVIQSVVGDSLDVTGTTDTVDGLIDGSDTIICAAFAGVRVVVIRGNIPIPGINPLDGSNYFTKVLSEDFITLNSDLVAGEFIRIQTIPA